jgi:hypothetical protein
VVLVLHGLEAIDVPYGRLPPGWRTDREPQGRAAKFIRPDGSVALRRGRPFNILIDLLWIGNDARRQALRDKFAGTYVIRRGAEPIARGPIRYEYYTILGNNFIFAEVRPDAKARVGGDPV